MATTPTAGDGERAARGLAIAQGRGAGIREVLAGKYLVPSAESGGGGHLVDLSARTCTCDDWELRGGPGRTHLCKHLYATMFICRELEMPDGDGVVVSEKRKTYPQKWKQYRQSRMKEKACVESFAAALCAGIEQPLYKGGRPRLPLADVIFGALMKVYEGFSCDRAQSDLESAKQRGLIDVVPSPNTILRAMRSPEIIPILKALIAESAKPVSIVRDTPYEVDFAADGTGIGTKNYIRWFDKKWGKEKKKNKWLKLHIIVGVKTQIITHAEVTPGNKGDSPQLAALLAGTAKSFKVREVSADKAYLSKKNLRAITDINAQPYIPFKVDSRVNTRDALWNKCLATFITQQDEFLRHYHKRSLSETTFSAIKRVLGANVRATSPDGQTAEVYLKVIAHNLRMLVQVMFDLNYAPRFWPTETTTADDTGNIEIAPDLTSVEASSVSENDQPAP